MLEAIMVTAAVAAYTAIEIKNRRVASAELRALQADIRKATARPARKQTVSLQK